MNESHANRWLDHPKEMREKARVGQDWALHHAQAEQFFEQLTELYYEQVSPDYGGQGMVGRSFHSPFYVCCRGAGGDAWCKREQQHKEPHYLHRAAAHPRHPASGGPVPTVMLDTSCAGKTGAIAPHAYKARWGKRNIDPNTNTALRVLLLQTKEEADRMDGIDPLYQRLLAESDNRYPYAELVRISGCQSINSTYCSTPSCLFCPHVPNFVLSGSMGTRLGWLPNR